MMPNQNTGMLKLGQHTVHGGKPDIDAFREQQTINIVRSQVAAIGLLEQGKDFQARAGHFQAQCLELIGTGHGG